jgi:hypothetical protein
MPQLHLYLPKEIDEEVRRRAEMTGISVSRYLADLVRSQVADEWPAGFFDEVVGGWVGEPLERPAQPQSEVRDGMRGAAGTAAPEGMS